jgi:DNA primase
MAGLIPQSFIDTLLDRTDIVEVVDRRVKLKKTGKNYSARCPFHDEKTPSFSVNPDKQFYYCFGCGAGGNAIGFVMDYDNVDFPQAIETLAHTAGLEVPREQTTPQQEAQRDRQAHLYTTLNAANLYFQQALRHHQQANRAVDYLKGRGLSGHIAKLYQIGFAPPGWQNLIERLDDKELESLIESGMAIRNDKDRTYDRFRDRIMFPIRDQRGRVVAFGGRVLGDEKPKYLNSPETPVFSKSRELYGLYEAKQSRKSIERIVVVEGYMDVIALAQHDIHYAVATLGTATSEHHLTRLYRLVSEVVFCFDGDKAGRAAAERALHTVLPLLEDGRQAKFLFLDEGEDPDTLVRKLGTQAFESLIKDARPVEQFLFDMAAEGLNQESLEGKATFSKRAVPLVQQLPSGVFKQLMWQALADRTGVDLASLTELAQIQQPKPKAILAQDLEPNEPIDRTQRAVQRTEVKSGPSKLALTCINLLLQRPDVAAQAQNEDIAILNDSGEALLSELLTLLRRQPHSNTAMLLGHWYGTAEGELLARLAGEESIIPFEGVPAQFSDCLRRLTKHPKIKVLQERINELSKRGIGSLSDTDKSELKELLAELRALESANS